MASRTVVLDGSGAEPSAVGGKAAALDRLIEAGMPVPRSGVITTEAYRDAVGGTALAQFLDQLPTEPPPPEEFDDQAADIERRFLSESVSPEFEEEITELARKVAGPDGKVAVRSSAVAEDTATASFAGQYRTVLHVPIDATPEAVRKVWASLWDPGVRAYRHIHGVSDEPAMAVIIMDMVDAEHAGVVFTEDPAGSASDVRVEYVKGVAERLVSGSETPEVQLVPREGRRPHEGPLGAVLDELVDLSLQVEDQLGGPQDIEWAYDGNDLSLVQARPAMAIDRPEGGNAGAVEADDGFDTPPLDDHAYTSIAVAEMLPGVLPPLQWTINGPLVEEGFRRLFDDLGILHEEPSRAAGFVGRFRGRVALNLSLVKSAAEDVPGASPQEVERQYFGEVISEGPEDDESDGAGPRTLLLLAKAARMRTRLRSEAAVTMQAVEDLLVMEVGIDDLDETQLVGYLERLIELARRITVAQVGVAATAAATYRAVELFLQRHVGEEAESLTQQLTAGGVADNSTGSLDLAALSEAATSRPEVAEILRAQNDPDTVRSTLQGSDTGCSFLEELDRVLARSGSASVFAGATWADSPGSMLASLHHTLDRAGSGGAEEDRRSDVLATLEERLTRTWKWRLTRLITGQVIDIRIRALRRLVTDAVVFLRLREEVKGNLLRLGGEARRVIVRIGNVLVDRTALGQLDDVDLLAVEELADMLAGGGPSAEVLEQRRAASTRAEEMGPLPHRFVGVPGAAAEEMAPGEHLEGWAASSGTYTGRPRVIRDQRSDPLEKGEILVAQSTNPSWTSLFLAAGAVVVEEGGPLSHAAIVARELGIPAVLNVPGAVNRLSSASSITVDGNQGVVVVHDDNDDSSVGSVGSVGSDDSPPDADEGDTHPDRGHTATDVEEASA